MIRNNHQNTVLHKLIADLNIDKETKADLVLQFTQERETSSAKMLVSECQELINHLNIIKNGPTDKKQAPAQNSVQNKMRRKILSICHEMNWKIGSQLDWNRINFWLEKYGYLHKELNRYTEAELPKLVTQFENLLQSYYAKR